MTSQAGSGLSWGASFLTLFRNRVRAGGKEARKLEIQRKEVHIEADWRGELFRRKKDFVVEKLKNHI